MTDASDTRPGEITSGLALRADATVQFIGRIETPWTDRRACPRQGDPDGPPCRVILDPPWDRALAGLNRFTYVELLYWLDRSRRDLLLQSPRADGRTVGTFALRSPVRPNPIGTALVRLDRIEGPVLHVRGLDCLNGTPLIDIKPDRCAYSPLAPPKS